VFAEIESGSATGAATGRLRNPSQPSGCGSGFVNNLLKRLGYNKTADNISLDGLTCLSPGDFTVVAKKADICGINNPSELTAMLRQEQTNIVFNPFSDRITGNAGE
jgi:hypothetical protein